MYKDTDYKTILLTPAVVAVIYLFIQVKSSEIHPFIYFQF